MQSPPRIGLIADTHGFLDPRITTVFAGVSHILHAGDIGDRSLIDELQRLAPTIAVAGNTDTDTGFPPTAAVDLHGHRFLVAHIVDPHKPAPDLIKSIRSTQSNIIVFGHTHRVFADSINGLLFVNPGSAGRRRWNTERSVAILHLETHGPSVEFHTLRD